MWLFYLVCLAFLFLPNFRLPMPGFIWEVWLRLLYIVLFLSMRLPPGVFIQSIIRFYHWAAYHLWNVFFPALALVCLTVLYNAFSGPEPWMAELSRQFFLHKFLNTLAMCFLAPVAEEIIFRGFLLNSSIGWGRYSRVSGIIITSLAFAIMHTQYLFAVTFVYLFVFSSILCVVRMRSRGLMIPIILHILNNAWVIFGLLFSATE